MNPTRATALCLESVKAEPFWDAAERLNAIQVRPVQPFERPQMVVNTVRPVADRRWPKCPLCSLGVSKCECDPDAYTAAVFAEMRAKSSIDQSRGEG